MEPEAALSSTRLEEELDWSMIMRTEKPTYDSYEAPTYTEPYGNTMRVQLVDDPGNNRLEELRRERLNRLSEMLTTRDKLTADPEKNRLAAWRKERHDKLMTMPSEMPPDKYYYQGTMCTEPYVQTMRDTHVPSFDNLIFQNRWREALDRFFKSEMLSYDLCRQTYNVPYGQTTMDKPVDDLHNNSRVHQPSSGLSIIGIGGIGKTAHRSHFRLYFDSDTMFQNTHSKTLLGGIFNRVRQQSLNSSFSSDQSFRMNIKDTIDFMLGMDKQETILRKKGADMDILRCIVDALAEECNCDVDPVLKACPLLKSAPTRFGGKEAGDLIKTAMKKERQRLGRIRHMGRRVVPRRRSLAQNRKIRGVFSRSDPIASDNSSMTPEQTWHVASAAPQHMTGYLNNLVDYMPASGDQVIDTPNMGPMAVHGRGSVNTASMALGDVLYVPGLDASLVSTGQLAELGYTIAIGPYGCRVYKDDGGMNLVGKAHYVDGYLLELDFLRVASTN